MKTPLAILNLCHQAAKTAVSVGGVAFALLLVFMQLGFMGAVSHTATNVLNNLDYDILIRARDYLHLYEPGTVDRKLLKRVEGIEGVASTAPFWITIQNWRTLPTGEQIAANESNERYLPIAVMATDIEDRLFVDPDIQAAVSRLTTADLVMLDDSTQKEYGPLNGKKFSAADLKRETEIGGRRFEIAGQFKLGTGLAANGALLCSPSGYQRITPWPIETTASIGLVKCSAKDEQALQRVVSQVRAALAISARESNQQGDDGSISPKAKFQELIGTQAAEGNGVVDVLTKQESLDRERARWLWQTPIGLIFQLGVVLSLLVGAAIVYMVLSTDVANRLPEYATLLAMGYSRKYLASIVMTQALALCGLGFVAAWAAAEVLYRVTTTYSSIPMAMTPDRVVVVGVLGVFMCCVSGLLALRKLWKAEPANLF